ncbi:glycosyltransferase family 2 protein [Paenibacillus sp. GCM10012307]|uniref:Glycosyltransferase family 2 protein n=2 Tax=Paenibacillus TaxID=44249 RepID=A0A934J5U3_9BACL|nr:glycosyltransferase [Paenibacillus roseus]MBJ6363824.1 glycosyltransferase family 2 protein [Paenibacillus roseus]
MTTLANKRSGAKRNPSGRKIGVSRPSSSGTSRGRALRQSRTAAATSAGAAARKRTKPQASGAVLHRRRVLHRNSKLPGKVIRAAYALGQSSALQLKQERQANGETQLFQDSSQVIQAMNAAFSKARTGTAWASMTALLHEGAAFRNGFIDAWGEDLALHPYVLLPLNGTAAAVVTVCNEEDSIRQVLNELQLLPLTDIIVVINGSTDHSFNYTKGFAGVTILHESEALGLDVGRALGAKLTKADIVLFIDGDFPVPAIQLASFLLAVDQGVDVALNDVTPYLGVFKYWDAVSRVKQFLNAALGRPDLITNSMTCVPHALSRRAIDTIGENTLAVPPKAQAAALAASLKVEASASINVFLKNRVREQNVGSGNPVARLIIGDHIEALKSIQRQQGARLSFPDQVRRRSRAGG